MIIKRFFLTSIFILSTFTIFSLAYPSSNKDISEIKNTISKYYPSELENSKIQDTIENAIKDGVPANQIENIIVKGAQSERKFEEIKDYILKLDYLAKQNILPEHAVNIILEGFAKRIDEKVIVEVINANEKEWVFCRQISKELFKKTSLKKSYKERLSIEKSILTLIDLGFDRTNIISLLRTADKKGKSPEYFNVVINVALKIKSFGWSDIYITKLLNTAVEYDLSEERLLDLVNMISDEMKIGKTQEQSINYIIRRLEDEYIRNQETKNTKREKMNQPKKSMEGRSKPSNDHGNANNNSGSFSSHKRQ